MDTRKILPPVEYLRACYNYDPSLGVLKWRERPLDHFQGNLGTQMYINSTHADKLVGLQCKGKYQCVKMVGERYLVHRVIYKMVTGEEPPHIIDHKDGNPKNNKWDNLRPATAIQNTQNTIRRGYQVTESGAFRVRLRVNFGTFNTEEEAQARYLEVTEALHGDFASSKRLEIIAGI